MTTSRIEFITRDDCSLCEVALEAVAAAARRHGVAVTVVDVDVDPALLASFDDRVPVVRDAVSGVVLAEGVIDRRLAEGAARAAARH